MLSLKNHHLSHLFTVAAILFCFAVAGSSDLRSQSWTPAGQMVGPLMLEFPITLNNGANLIPLRWVNKRYIDSVYWFDIDSFGSTPKMYERQTPEFNGVSFVGDFDTDGVPDVFGHRKSGSPIYLYSALTPEEHTRPAVSGQYGIKSGVTNRYFGDVDGDGLNDDYIAESATSARIVYGDKKSPFTGPSYVALFDNSREIYPDLPPTRVVLVGMLGGKPCIVQSYQVLPDTPPYYELHELNMDDLRARAPKIRTRLLQKLNGGENRFYGNVVLRTPDVWWLFSVYGTDSSPNGIKVAPTSMTFEPVSGYWKGAESQYYGQGGKAGDENYPRVMDGNRPFVRVDYRQSKTAEGDTVRHAVFTLARLVDAETATVEIIGSGYPLQSQYHEASAVNIVLVPDIDHDGIDDYMVTLSYWDTPSKQYQNSVALYLTSQRPTVTVKDIDSDSTRIIVDQGESWRIVNGISCLKEPVVLASIYDVNGADVSTVVLTMSGTDVIVSKPKFLSYQALWMRLGACTLRLP